MTKIYLLLQCWDYEGGEAIAAFHDKDSAYKMKDACEEHRMSCSSYNRDEQWRQEHPVGDWVSSCVDKYVVTEVELRG